jgi:hypothetical protein
VCTLAITMRVCFLNGPPLNTAAGRMKAALNRLLTTLCAVLNEWKLLSCALVPHCEQHGLVPGKPGAAEPHATFINGFP